MAMRRRSYSKGLGALMGVVPGRPIPVINAGRNSSAAIFEQIVTKAGNGTINSVTLQTAEKMAVGAFVRYSVVEGAMAGTTLSNIYGNLTAQPQAFGNFSGQPMQPAQQPSGK